MADSIITINLLEPPAEQLKMVEGDHSFRELLYVTFTVQL